MNEHAYGTVAVFAARLVALGVTDAVISPGSRSAPLALCFHACGGLRTWVQIDERSAGFFALGLGRATGRPAVLVCTSGTAAANYLPAVIEAHHAGVPLIACTADRPPERRGWGEPQTIDQVGLYRPAVRWDCDLPVPDRSTVAAAPGWAETAFTAATEADPGPVHLNWPFREPLEPTGDIGRLPENSEAPAAVMSETAADSARPPSATGTGPAPLLSEAAADSASPPSATGTGPESPEAGSPTGGHLGPAEDGHRELSELIEGCDRGVVVAGPWPAGGLEAEQAWAAAVADLAARAGWPLIGEPIAHVRGPGRRAGACVVTTADHLLSDEALGDMMRPEAVVMFGRTPTTKPVRLWLERTRPDHVVLIDPADRRHRAAPALRLTGHVPAPPDRPRLELPPTAEPSQPSPRSAASRPAPGLGPAPAAEPSQPRRDWLAAWGRLESRARTALDREIEAGPMLSALTARTVVASLPAGSVLLASNSLPVRDLDAFVPDTGAVTVVGNRGASGIDGTASTALGLAAADPARPAALYTGDLALLHDLSGLAAAARLGLHLTVVCVDNGGGGIFSLLPVADRIDLDDFDTLFRTPHGADFADLHGFTGIRVRRAASAEALAAAVRGAAAPDRAPGVDLVVVPVDGGADTAQRRALTAAALKAAKSGSGSDRDGPTRRGTGGGNR